MSFNSLLTNLQLEHFAKNRITYERQLEHLKKLQTCLGFRLQIYDAK